MAVRAGNGSVLGVHGDHANSGDFDGIQFEYPDQHSDQQINVISGNPYDDDPQSKAILAMCIGFSVGLSILNDTASFGDDGTLRLPDDFDLPSDLGIGAHRDQSHQKDSNANVTPSAACRVPLPACCWGYGGFAKAEHRKRSSVDCVPLIDPDMRE